MFIAKTDSSISRKDIDLFLSSTKLKLVDFISILAETKTKRIYNNGNTTTTAVIAIAKSDIYNLYKTIFDNDSIITPYLIKKNKYKELLKKIKKFKP